MIKCSEALGKIIERRKRYFTPSEIETVNVAHGKLIALEEMEKQGRLVILPCKVGDTFYYIAGTLRGNEYVASDTVAAIEISDTEPWIIDSCGCHHIKFWFSREEAEAALKGESENV